MYIVYIYIVYMIYDTDLPVPSPQPIGGEGGAWWPEDDIIYIYIDIN